MELDRLTVVQGNDLLEGAYSVTLDEMRLLNLALAQIDSRKPQPDTLYRLYPQDYQRIYGLNPTSSHRQLRDAAESLMKKPVTIYKPDRKTGKMRTVKLSWFSRLEYVSQDEQSAVILRFGQDVAPYLYELKESFTKLHFTNIAKLDTPFSVRLYSWLIKAKNLYGRNSTKAIEVTLTLEWMREKAGLTGKYMDYRDFRQKLLESTVTRINANTDISVVWEPVKQGRTVVAIKFTYINESNPVQSKPVRPRLPRRPRAEAGSALEGEWARKCIHVMEGYVSELTQYDVNEKLPVLDLRKLASWYAIIGDKSRYSEIEADIKSRSKK
jgi:Protein involved in initiation of plasmid replication